MSRGWTLVTFPGRPDGFTGEFSDTDRQFRLTTLVSTLTRAEAGVVEAERALRIEIEGARRQGQQALIDEAVKLLAERRARAIEG